MSGRILLHAGSQYGEVRSERLAELSREVFKVVPRSTILLATESDGVKFGDLPPNADFVRVPIDESPISAEHPPHKALRFEILRATVRRFPPNVFVLDTSAPSGVSDWLPFLAELRRDVPECSIVLVWEGAWTNGSTPPLPREVLARFDEIWALGETEAVSPSDSGVSHFLRLGNAAPRLAGLLSARPSRKRSRFEDSFPSSQ